jgi:hypothetical protein
MLTLCTWAISLTLLNPTHCSQGYWTDARNSAADAVLQIDEKVNPLSHFDKPAISKSEKSMVDRHFKSHNNSLDSVSDFGYGRHGDHNTTNTSKDESHDYSHESHVLPHDEDDGRCVCYG